MIKATLPPPRKVNQESIAWQDLDIEVSSHARTSAAAIYCTKCFYNPQVHIYDQDKAIEKMTLLSARQIKYLKYHLDDKFIEAADRFTQKRWTEERKKGLFALCYGTALLIGGIAIPILLYTTDVPEALWLSF